jgi:hypothetical protein
MKRALFVGLNDYPNNPLSGCVADATSMCDILKTHEDDSPNFETRLMLKASEVTRRGLKSAIKTLLEQPADIALLFFSGHGYLNDQLGGYLVTADATSHEEGVAMSDILKLANESPVDEVVIILDCCHSGAFGNAASSSQSDAALYLREGRSILTASRAHQTATEVNGQGTFTALVLDALNGGAADVLGKVTVASVYAYVDEVLGAWDERPLLKANVSRLNPLRKCKSQVALDILRRLSQYFPESDYIFPLDPSFEPDPPKGCTHERNPKNERIFDELQKFRAARLVEPVGEEHMYYAAINSKACRLSKLGQFYWRLSKDGKI